MCVTTTHWATHISSECQAGGSGQCDGICYEHGVDCTCSCHNAADLPFTVSKVRDWHDDLNDVVESFEYVTHGGEVAAERAATLRARELNGASPDGRTYAPRIDHEARRAFITFTF